MNHQSLVDGDLREPVAAGIARFVDDWAEHRQPAGAPREIAPIEPALDVSVRVRLDAMPLDRFHRFVDALRPRLEEFRVALAGTRARQP